MEYKAVYVVCGSGRGPVQDIDRGVVVSISATPSPAHWVTAKVGGTEVPVLFQVFERRVLTYNPANPAGYLERGEYSPSLDLAFRISEYLGLPIEAIFSRHPFPLLSDLVYKSPPQEAEPKAQWTAPSRPEPSTGS